MFSEVQLERGLVLVRQFLRQHRDPLLGLVLRPHVQEERLSARHLQRLPRTRTRALLHVQE